MALLKFNVWKGAKHVGAVSATIEWAVSAPGNWAVVSPWKFAKAKGAKVGLPLAVARALCKALNADPLTRGEALGLRLTKDCFSHQPVVLMTADEAVGEVEWLSSCFDSCREGGHGISSKDSIRMRDCIAKARAAGHTIYAGGY